MFTNTEINPYGDTHTPDQVDYSVKVAVKDSTAHVPLWIITPPSYLYLSEVSTGSKAVNKILPGFIE